MTPLKRTSAFIASALFILASTTGCGEAEPQPSKGLVIQSADTSRPYFHDFGVIQDGTRPIHTFKILNTEPNPVTLKDVLPSCSCVVPSVRAISPNGATTKGSTRGNDPVCTVPSGGTLEIDVALDTKHIRRKNADRLSTIRLRTDSPVTPFLTLELHVLVEQLIQATPWELNLGELPQSAGGSGVTTVVPTSLILDLDIINARAISGDGLTTSFQLDEQVGRKVWLVKAELKPGLKLGPWQGSMKIQISAPTEDPPTRELIVPIRAQIVEDITLRPRRAFLMKANTAGAEFTVKALIPGERVRISSARMMNCPAEAFSSTVTPVRPDANGKAESWKIRVVHGQAAQSSPIDARLVVTLSDGRTLSAALSAR